MSQPPDNPGVTPADLGLVASYPTHREAHDRGLVALSMGLPYWVFELDGRFHLLVAASRQEDVGREVAIYDREVVQPYAGYEPIPFESRATVSLCYLTAIFLAAAFLFQKSDELWAIKTFGNDSIAVRTDGQWWRTATALAMHSDLAHLLGNLAFGTWFGILAARALGPWIATLGILVSGMLGNALAGAIYFPTPSTSIGASTAVFGALGLLVGHGLINALRQHSLAGLSGRLAPFAGGLALLGLTGAGDAQTDILAHCTGFGAGVVAGLFLTLLAERSRKMEPLGVAK